jgi:hypothetical protein
MLDTSYLFKWKVFVSIVGEEILAIENEATILSFSSSSAFLE